MGLLDDLLSGYQQVTQPLNTQLSDVYSSYEDWAKKNKELLPDAINKFAEHLDSIAQTPGADVLMPGLPVGMLVKNYRTVEQIQDLRRMMAEENAARGPMSQKGKEILVGHHISDPRQILPNAEFWQTPASSLEQTIPDPIDQILRGSWYHGMAGKAREGLGSLVQKKTILDPTLAEETLLSNLIAKPYDAIVNTIKEIHPNAFFNPKGAGTFMDDLTTAIQDISEQYKLTNLAKLLGVKLPTSTIVTGGGEALSRVFETGFPISLHDSQSISNKLGEPAGVSLSLNPIKSGLDFSPDQYIHRVQPQYGGPPLERVVNLMTQEGRNTLNDAYDVVANRQLFEPNTVLGSTFTPADVVSDIVLKRQAGRPNINEALIDTFSGSYPAIGQFNKALSDQLQSMGKRGILYNPLRWNEYEMLMLDPKYVLPLDYRKYGEYLNKRLALAPTGGIAPAITPQAGRGLDQIQEVMAQNKSRLGDIYSERPWTQRLNEENKNRLLELIDPQYREIVGNQLYGTPKPYDIPF